MPASAPQTNELIPGKFDDAHRCHDEETKFDPWEKTVPRLPDEFITQLTC